MGQQLVRRKVDVRQGAHGGAQSSHGGRGVDPMAHDVPDDHGHPGAGQRNHVEPVAARAIGGMGGQVAPGDIEGAAAGETAREQAALQGQRGAVLPGVAAGVVEAHRGAGHDLLGEQQIILLERIAQLPANEPDDAQHFVEGPDRDQNQGAVTELMDLRGAGRVGGEPATGGRPRHGLQTGAPIVHALHLG